MNSGGASQKHRPGVFRAQRFGVRGLVRALGLVETCLRGRGVCGCAMCAPAARTSPLLRKAASSRRSPKRGARKVPHPGRVHWQRSEETQQAPGRRRAAQSRDPCRATFAGFFAALPMMSSETGVQGFAHNDRRDEFHESHTREARDSQSSSLRVEAILADAVNTPFCERLRMTRVGMVQYNRESSYLYKTVSQRCPQHGVQDELRCRVPLSARWIHLGVPDFSLLTAC